MKKEIILMLSVVVLATGCATREVREVHVASLDELPFPVQKTIREQSHHGNIAKVDRETYGGRTLYEVSFHDPLHNPHLTIAPDGTLLSGGTRVINEAAGAAGVRPTTGLRFEDLPVAVQTAIRLYAPGGHIADIDKEARVGGTVYEVKFAEPGRDSTLHIREDGMLVEETD